MLPAFLFCALSMPAFQSDELAAKSEQAKTLMAAHRFAEAIPIYRELLKAVPGNSGLLFNLGLAEHLAGREAESIPHFEGVLKAQPNFVPALVSLGAARLALNQPERALGALNHLLKLKPDDPDAMVAWVEATAENSPSHRIDDASRAKLQRALQIEPTHQRALWLLGISDFQRNNFADAEKQWKTLLPLLDPGSRVAETVKQELAEAEARGGNTQGAALAADPAPAASSAASASAEVALTLTVKLDPRLAAKVRPDDTLFVFARAVDGPPMPLAVARLKASDLPAKVTLTDAMAMTPAMTLSKFAKVNVAARISKSGNAMPQAGDLESAPIEVATDTRTPVTLTIDRVD